MELFYAAEQSDKPLAVALGFFDGLHLGHQAVVQRVLAQKEKGLIPTVITFQMHPQKLLKGKEPPLLMTNESKIALLKQWGVERIYLLDFSQFAKVSAESFVWDILFERLNTKFISCGFNFRFGFEGRGNGSFLAEEGKKASVEVEILPQQTFGGESISSTRIRRLLQEGKAEETAQILGRWFSYCFEVVHGRHLGAAMGTPTLNQIFPDNFILPKFGVYASRALVDGKWYAGVTNIGVKPTVGSDRALSETWLPHFSGDLYGKYILIELLSFIRPEKKFSGLDELKAEIIRNGKEAEKIVQKNMENIKL